MSKNRQSHGQQAENLTKKFLQAKGYRFQIANYRCQYGEIDLIFTTSSQTIFVEVKSRTDESYETPAQAITPQKLSKIMTTAQHFLQSHENLPQSGRIDAVAITQTPFAIDHIENISME
jgi:putative endonuclease